MERTYYLTCTECLFDRRVDGFEDAMEVADAHSAGLSGHFVDVFLVDDTDVTSDPSSIGQPAAEPSSAAAGDEE